MSREILWRMFWCAVVAAVWVLSMIHSEHVGMREQAAKDHCWDGKSSVIEPWKLETHPGKESSINRPHGNASDGK